MHVLIEHFAQIRAAILAGAAGLAVAAPALAAGSLTATRAELDMLRQVPAHAVVPTDGRPVLPRHAISTFDRLWLWSEIALDTTAIDHTPVKPGETRKFGEELGPARSARAMAIIHIAMFEAENAVTQRYRSYVGLPPQSGDISLDWAIAQASHDAQLWLYPSQQPRLDALLALDGLFINATPAEKQAGIALGKSAAAAIIALRTNDGAQVPDPTVGVNFFPKVGPGYWSIDPISQKTVALGAFWTNVKPFALTSSSQFRAPPPPALTDPAYTAAFIQEQQLGGDPKNGTPTQRTPSETFQGIFWTYDGVPYICAPPRLYNQLARTVALGQGMNDVPTAGRFLALLNTAMADAALAAWDTKWYYQYWRPVTAIRSADQGGNNQVVPNPNFYPLGAQATNVPGGPNFTPPFPAYVSGHATIGGAVFETLRQYWPDSTPFTFVSDEFNGLNRDIHGHLMPFHPMSFPSFSAASYSNAESRIWIGVHWQYDADYGVAMGTQVADWTVANAFQPVSGAKR